MSNLSFKTNFKNRIKRFCLRHGGGGQRFQLLLVSVSKNLSQTFDYLLAWSLMLYLAWIGLKNSATAWLRPKYTLKTFKFVQKLFFCSFSIFEQNMLGGLDLRHMLDKKNYFYSSYYFKIVSRQAESWLGGFLSQQFFCLVRESQEILGPYYEPF